jgi:large subunit ribosomal protein L31
MKSGIHPQYNNITATCVCGGKFATGSTRDEIKVEICSQCHPFYTGKQKLVDTAGRVDKFKSRMEASAKMKQARNDADKTPKIAEEKPAVDGKIVETAKKEK